jgi:hypothetical protein
VYQLTAIYHRKLTHGRLDKLTKSGRVAESWLGATEEVGKRLHSSVCEGLVDREGILYGLFRIFQLILFNCIVITTGRYDLRLPQFVVDQLQLDAVLGPILEKLSSVMGTPAPQVRTHNVVFVPVGSKPQKWHVDDTVREGKTHRYFTILIHLNSLDSCCGGTEMWIEKQQCGDMVSESVSECDCWVGLGCHLFACMFDDISCWFALLLFYLNKWFYNVKSNQRMLLLFLQVRSRPGDAFVFNGSLLHRGQANLGKVHRFFYYASFACKADTNTGNV